MIIDQKLLNLSYTVSQLHLSAHKQSRNVAIDLLISDHYKKIKTLNIFLSGRQSDYILEETKLEDQHTPYSQQRKILALNILIVLSPSTSVNTNIAAQLELVANWVFSSQRFQIIALKFNVVFACFLFILSLCITHSYFSLTCCLKNKNDNVYNFGSI